MFTEDPGWYCYNSTPSSGDWGVFWILDMFWHALVFDIISVSIAYLWHYIQHKLCYSYMWTTCLYMFVFFRNQVETLWEFFFSHIKTKATKIQQMSFGRLRHIGYWEYNQIHYTQWIGSKKDIFMFSFVKQFDRKVHRHAVTTTVQVGSRQTSVGHWAIRYETCTTKNDHLHVICNAFTACIHLSLV